LVNVEMIRARLAAVEERIAAAAARAGRDPGEVTLVGISKTMPLAAVEAAYGAGITHLGENRVQEAVEKYAAFKPEGLTLHLVGHLQRNKARRAALLFDFVHSVDSPALADALAEGCRDRAAPLPVLVEVNLAGEESKFGVAPEAALPLLAHLLTLPALAPRGLMTIAPLVPSAEEVRPVFRGLRALRDRCQAELGVDLPHLSMGMTNDYEVAIEEGATLVRIGRAIFGERG
jgi:pyridoxal phosphate enzyme (YggS family)